MAAATQTSLGAEQILQAERKLGVDRFVRISTDKGYEEFVPGAFADENSRRVGSRPYTMSKASADLLVRSYVCTYRFQEASCDLQTITVRLNFQNRSCSCWLQMRSMRRFPRLWRRKTYGNPSVLRRFRDRFGAGYFNSRNTEIRSL